MLSKLSAGRQQFTLTATALSGRQIANRNALTNAYEFKHVRVALNFKRPVPQARTEGKAVRCIDCGG